MKAFLITIITVLVLLFGSVLLLQNVNLNRLGTDQYYVQVGKGVKMEDKADDGMTYVYYQYTLNGFDKDGKEKNVKFTANKELRKDAYLRVYLKGGKASSYQEVQAQELPEPAKRELEGH